MKGTFGGDGCGGNGERKETWLVVLMRREGRGEEVDEGNSASSGSCRWSRSV